MKQLPLRLEDSQYEELLIIQKELNIATTNKTVCEVVTHFRRNKNRIEELIKYENTLLKENRDLKRKISNFLLSWQDLSND